MAAEAHAPLAPDEVDRLFALLEPARGLGLAVSGGADSVALMRLVADWRRRTRPDLPVVVFTVDHGLRPESACEAQSVGDWVRGAGLVHETLRWTGDKPGSGLQEAAREARYALMAKRCSGLGLTHLATAHHLDDQAETVLMRLARGSGLDGLAGMAPSSRLHGPVLVRPCLDLPKSRLIATLRELGQQWIEDPSNSDERFFRARLRGLMPRLAAEGLTPSRLARTARRLARARNALDAAAADLHRRCIFEDPAGFCRIDLAALADAPDEIGLRVLARLFMGVAGVDRPPRLHRLERLHADLIDRSRGGRFAGATLGGCRLLPEKGDIIVCREGGRHTTPAVELSDERPVLWDGRFHVRLNRPLHAAASVRPLGGTGVSMLRRDSALRRMPGAAARLSAGVFIGERLFAAPQLEAEPGCFSPPGVEINFIGGARFASARDGADGAFT